MPSWCAYDNKYIQAVSIPLHYSFTIWLIDILRAFDRCPLMASETIEALLFHDTWLIVSDTIYIHTYIWISTLEKHLKAMHCLTYYKKHLITWPHSCWHVAAKMQVIIYNDRLPKIPQYKTIHNGMLHVPCEIVIYMYMRAPVSHAYTLYTSHCHYNHSDLCPQLYKLYNYLSEVMLTPLSTYLQ